MLKDSVAEHAANYGFTRELREHFKAVKFEPGRGSVTGRAVLEGRAIQIHDVHNDPEFDLTVGMQMWGARTLMGIPLLREDIPIAALVLGRSIVKPFTDQQIALAGVFANQAAIAVENTRLLNELRQRTDGLTKSLEQLTATSEVLQVVSRSPADLEPVFAAMLEKAVRVCGAKFGNLWLREGDLFRIAATHDAPQEWSDFLSHEPAFRVDPRFGLGQLVVTKQTYHTADITAEPTYQDKLRTATIELAHARTLIGVPLLKGEQVIGVLAVYRQEVRPFTDKQIKVVENFAAQAVIAIENARLLNELRQSLEQQTATSDVLKVISRSTFELQKVLDTLVETAARLCRAERASIVLPRGDVCHRVASYGFSVEFRAFMDQHPLPMDRGNIAGRVLRDRRTIQVKDIQADPEWAFSEASRLGGVCTILGVPLMREDTPIGVLVLTRTKVEPFNEKHIELVETFADQAVIAIENARLLSELRQRTDDLTESLEQQTATAEVLRVISSSPGEIEPVFASIMENAAHICEANFVDILRREGDGLRLVAAYNTPPAFEELRRRAPLKPPPGNPIARMMATKTAVHVTDLAADPHYAQRSDPGMVAAVELGGVRTFIVVPLLKDDDLVGALIVFRQEVRPFTEKQISLLTNFASQAVIAIENARLLTELRESLERQTATSEVLGVISRSKFDLQPILQSVVDTAERLCRAEQTVIYRLENGVYRFAAGHSSNPAYLEIERNTLISPGPGTVVGRAAMTGQIARIDDAWSDPLYEKKEDARVGGIRSMIGVPLMRDGDPIGAIALARNRVDPFNDREIELVATFADQAVIAIENVRLFEAEQERTRELSESLERQTATSEILRVISASPGELQGVFDSVLANATRLCEATFGNLLLNEGARRFRIVAMHNAPSGFAELRRREPVIELGPQTPLARAAATKATVQVADFATEESYRQRSPSSVVLGDLGGARSFLVVPMLKEGKVIGAIAIYRQEVKPFTDKQTELVQNFAAQAVIAIENARLLSELRARTDQLARSVEELRALGETSQAVNSTLDLEMVLNTIVTKAVQLSGTEAGAIYVFDIGREFRLRATYGMDQTLITALGEAHIRTDEQNIALMLANRDVVQVSDLAEVARSPVDDIVFRAGYRARFAAPLFSGDDIVGLLVVRRRTPGAFLENTVDLMKTFAAQSALAIQNARLFHEIEEKGRELEVASKHKSQFLANMSHELRTPLNAILGYTELMLDSIYGEVPEKMRAVLERVQTNGKHLLGLDQRRARLVEDRGRAAYTFARRLLAGRIGPKRLRRGRAAGLAEESGADHEARKGPAGRARRRASARSGAAQSGR